MPEHGESEALILCQEGRIREGKREETLEPGGMALIRTGERVSLENLSGSKAVAILASSPHQASSRRSAPFRS